jgi:hypothetical protein
VYLFRILSFTSELFLFLYAGFSMWSTTLWQGDIYSRVGGGRGAGTRERERRSKQGDGMQGRAPAFPCHAYSAE